MTNESDIEARWLYALALARKHAILCTGSTQQPKCEQPGALPVILYGQLFAVVCREHAEPLLSDIAAQGLGAGIRCGRLDELLTYRPDFPTGARLIRESNHRRGVIIRAR